MKKRFLAIVLMTITALIVSACGTSKSSETSGTGSDGQKKELRVVTDAAYAPFEYMEGDKIVGFDIDFLKAVAKEAGYELKIENVGWDPIFVEIKSKRADLAVSSITINDDRKQTYDFSLPYFLSTNKILVREDSDIKSAADLKGKVVAVQNGTTGQEAMDKLLGKNSKDIKKFDNNNLAIMEMLSGGADAVVADNGVVEVYAKNNPKEQLKVIEDSGSFEAEFYGLLFPKGTELKADFDKAIKKVFENGTYEKIYQEWFGQKPNMEKLKAEQEASK
ncbi:basic amino acid ABC transporter substrate-binding protein [Mesobacillus subterraneus]|uniref:basic amino acid ABC transporter substrate-binding protein n=1 Tax=Mesobacillus subterraneus TaxID=285983 RepID=UPI00203D76CA|nr:basic amino acid ABC transporter substrate-binding protein [Mesobacillus subterraneus]MCM3666828.1 basic amino acid ABC transporter substrate-binding protein [Mesobacillus subterraneus]MCM3684997.1 basic amino acid ABC transporter substrate-binding protein [Mesobacillus subterraneus]